MAEGSSSVSSRSNGKPRHRSTTSTISTRESPISSDRSLGHFEIILTTVLNQHFTLRDALTYGIHDSEHILRHVRPTNPSLRLTHVSNSSDVPRCCSQGTWHVWWGVHCCLNNSHSYHTTAGGEKCRIPFVAPWGLPESAKDGLWQSLATKFEPFAAELYRMHVPAEEQYCATPEGCISGEIFSYIARGRTTQLFAGSNRGSCVGIRSSYSS